jgi:hypothetical protein
MKQYATVPFIDEQGKPFHIVYYTPDMVDPLLIRDGLKTWMPREKARKWIQIGPARVDRNRPTEIEGRTPVPVPCSEASSWLLAG